MDKFALIKGTGFVKATEISIGNSITNLPEKGCVAVPKTYGLMVQKPSRETGECCVCHNQSTGSIQRTVLGDRFVCFRHGKVLANWIAQAVRKQAGI